MSVLPRFIYLFQCLYVVVPGAYFKKLHLAFLTYIWNGKKSHLKKDRLKKSKQDGGLALPNIRHFYGACNLGCLSFWVLYSCKDGGPIWVEMEKLLCAPFSLPVLIGATLPLPLNHTSSNHIVYNSLAIYSQFRKHFGFHQMSLSSPI